MFTCLGANATLGLNGAIRQRSHFGPLPPAGRGSALNQKFLDDTLHINRPCSLIYQGLNRIHTVIASTVNGLHKIVLQGEDADDLLVVNNALMETDPAVPKEAGLFVDRHAVKSLNIHIDSVKAFVFGSPVEPAWLSTHVVQFRFQSFYKND